MPDTQARSSRPRRDKTRGAAFADLIHDARKRRGWSHDKLAEESGVGRTTIFRWEGGDAQNPTPDQIRAVCAALGIDPKQALLALGYLTDADLAPAA